jgi:opacity protein-like surface antigen
LEIIMLGKSGIVLVALASLIVAAGRVQAQQTASQKAAAKSSASDYHETDLGVGVYRSMTSPTTAKGVVQTPVNSLGGMVELRHLVKPLVGYEFTFAFNPADEGYAPTATNCGYSCNTPPQKLNSKASSIGVDWVVSDRFGRMRPFAVGGLGFIFNVPGNSIYGVNNVSRPIYIFGGGVDFAMSSHLGVRLQFRRNIYTSPDLSTLFPGQGVYTHMDQPMGGLFYSF